MKVTYNWLKDFAEIKIPAQALADKLTMAGLEVVSLEERSGDYIFEIEVTSNRPDWLSVLGIAREAAAITKSRIKSSPPAGRQGKSKATNKISKNCFGIEIEDKKDCPLYTARIIKNVKVGPSPEWLKKRLELIGCRSVNNIVDITNYVLFELGEPLHAFDLDKLSGEKIFVRRAKGREKIITIDGQERLLEDKTLVISDKDKPAAIAGVMGAKYSEVTLNTRNILLEAAVFNPILVRRGRQAQGLQSESSYRFERGIDSGIVERASLRAAELIKEYCSGEEICFEAKGLSKKPGKTINLDVAYASRILGINITTSKSKQILSSLGFKVREKSKNILSVGIASFRQDVGLEVDLIEEISRIFGYERIPVSLPAVKPFITVREKRSLVSVVKNILVSLGVNEVITYSLTDKETLNSLGLNLTVKPIEIMNPLSLEQEVLRPTLLAGLIRSVAFNLNQKQDYISIFEIANIFKGGEKPQEELTLGIALSGAKSLFLGQAVVKDEAGLLNLKGVLETVFERLGILDYEFSSQCSPVIDIFIRQEKIGSMFKPGPQALNKFDIKNNSVFALEVSLDKILGFAELNRKFIPLPRFPGITRDVSFALKEDLSLKELLNLLKEKGQPFLRDARITDYYKGKQIPQGYRGLTVSCLYSSLERTLTEEEIQPAHNLVCRMLTEQFGAIMR